MPGVVVPEVEHFLAAHADKSPLLELSLVGVEQVHSGRRRAIDPVASLVFALGVNDDDDGADDGESGEAESDAVPLEEPRGRPGRVDVGAEAGQCRIASVRTTPDEYEAPD